jgi:DNA-binding transcriptional ArsR family regulator
MGHYDHDLDADQPLSDEEVTSIAELTQALATPSRVRLLYGLRDGEMPVTELAESAGVALSAASQQLRVLRHLKLVQARRAGRSVLYRLHDEHVASLLEEVRGHVRHVALDLPSAVTPVARPRRARSRA